jgi:hypothetical protein
MSPLVPWNNSSSRKQRNSWVRRKLKRKRWRSGEKLDVYVEELIFSE